jgi:non-specific serine/threonine protein kinase
MKSDPRVISDIPEKMEIDEYLSLTPEQAAVYQRVLDEMLPGVQSQQGIHRKGIILAAITKLKQVCDHPSLVMPGLPFRPAVSGKLIRLAEILETILDEGDRALVFTQYARMGEFLQRFLQERFNTEVPFLHGALPRLQRDALVQKFQSPEGPPFFVLSLKAGGFGLNLTAANQVIHFDQWWNPAVESQATDRVYRIGQTKNVQVRRFICRGTLEEKIAVLLQEKKKLAADVLPSAGNALTELSFEELRRVLSLAPDAFVEEGDE